MKYWVYMNGEVPGSFAPLELVELPGFTGGTLVCPAEGEILEKNWRHAGEFPDIVESIQKKQRAEPSTQPKPPAPPITLEAAMSSEVDKHLDSSGTRLFRHVSGLMKELSNRREERSLTLSLQRQIADLKEQLLSTRERLAAFESRAAGALELEKSAQLFQAKIDSLETARKTDAEILAETRKRLESARMELDFAKQRLSETSADLGVRNRLIDKLTQDIAEKELSLAKSLGVISRLESDLQRIIADAAFSIPPLPPLRPNPPKPLN